MPDNTYKRSLFLAVILHGILFAFLFVRFALPQMQLMGAPAVHIVNASLVSQEQVQAQLDAIKQQQEQQRAAELAKIQAQQKQQKLAEQQALAAKQQQEQQQLKQEQEKQAQVAQTKAAQEKAVQQKHVLEQAQIAAEQKQQKLKVAAEKQKLAAIKKQQQAAAAASIQKQLAKEQKQIVAAPTKAVASAAAASTALSQEQQSEIDKYKALIVQTIGQNWIVPPDAGSNISCQVLIHVGPGGAVLSAEVVSSSGDAALDSSAKTAVLKSSPLPVPDDSKLFDKFRELRLTVKPGGD